MEEDILALMEALTTQASDADPDPGAAASVGVAPPIQTLPLEDALSTACQRVSLGQKTEHQKETPETREMFSFSPCLSATDPGLCTDVALEVSPGTHGGGNVGKKSSRKRRNKTKSKVYLSWPVTLETRESSTRQASVMEALFSKEPRRKREKEKAAVPAQLWYEPASSWLPKASPVQPSLEEISVTARKKRKAQKRRHCRKRAKKNQKIESSPWPVTVQAWASFVNPELVQTSFTDFLPAADHAGVEDDVSVFSLSKSTQTDIPDSPAPLLQAFWEEVAPAVNTKRKIKKKKHTGWQGKMDNALDQTWPPEIQVWAPFQAATAPVQALSEDMSLQWECWPPLESEKERECFLPWSGGTEEGAFSAIAPLQISLEEVPAMKFGQPKTDETKRRPDTREEQFQGSEVLALESYQSWGNAEQHQGHQDKDDWDYSILDMLTQAECYYGDPFSEEGDKAPPLTGSDAYTSISEAETDRQEAEEDKATFQTLWMGKWGGF